MVGSAVAGGVVQGDGQIRRRRAVQPLFDGFPRRQPIAEADDRKVVGQRRTQHRCGAASRRQTRYHLNFRLLRLAPQLIDQRRHAVDAAVTGADHGDGLTAARQLQRQLAALGLPCHGGGVKLLAGVAIPHQIHIHRVAYDGVTRPQGGIRPNGHILIAARPDTYYNYLTQSAPPNAPPRRRWSRRPALFFVRSVFRHPAAPPAHRHCPRR